MKPPLPPPVYARKLFGTDGIRGKAYHYPLTEDFLFRLGETAARLLGPSPHILIGRDTRQSGTVLEEALVKGLTQAGAKVGLLGVVPTASIAYFVRQVKASAGIALTASHNSYEDNGVKFFNHEGYKLDDAMEFQLEQETLNPSSLTSTEKGQSYFISDAAEKYARFAKSTLDSNFSLHDMTLAVDVAHGAAYQITPYVLKQLGACVHAFNDQPTGTNINLNCGSTYPEKLQEYVKQTRAQVGISHDGDADRVIFCDETGEILDGDEVLAIIAVHLLQKKTLKNNTLVATVMSNLALNHCLESYGGKVIRTDVGDRYVIEAMRKGDYNFGGETSGHLIFRDYTTSGDGLISALQVLRLIQETGKSLHDLKKILTLFPQRLINMKVREKKSLDQMPQVKQALEEAKKELGSKGRVLLRYSGTELKIRLLIESEKEEDLHRLEEKILEPIKEEIGV